MDVDDIIDDITLVEVSFDWSTTTNSPVLTATAGININLQYSTNNGGSWTTLQNFSQQYNSGGAIAQHTDRYDLTSIIGNNYALLNALELRINGTHNSGGGTLGLITSSHTTRIHRMWFHIEGQQT